MIEYIIVGTILVVIAVAYYFVDRSIKKEEFEIRKKYGMEIPKEKENG